jgi:hypothetical protein
VLSCDVKIDTPPRAGLPRTPTLDNPPSRSIPFHYGNFHPCNMLQTFRVSPFPASLSQKQGGRVATGQTNPRNSSFASVAIPGGLSAFWPLRTLRLCGESFFLPARTYFLFSFCAHHSSPTTHHFSCFSQTVDHRSTNTHRVQIQWHTVPPEEACGKLIFRCNAGLTYWEHVLILVSSLQATLLDRGVEQTLFDNLIDVPESVRPIHRLRA